MSRRTAEILVVIALVALSGWVVFRGYRGATRPDRGDFRHFYWGAEALVHGEDLYDSGERGYIYPPPLAVAMEPLVALGRPGADLAWLGISVVMIGATLVVGQRVIRRHLGPTRDRAETLGVALLALLLTVEQVRWNLEEGQTDVLVLLSFIATLVLIDRAPVIGGALAGLATTIKYQAIIALPYAVVRGRWRLAAGIVGGAVGVALAPALVLGWHRNLSYLARAFEGLGVMLGIGEATGHEADMNGLLWHASISVPSAIGRQIAGADGSFSVPLLAALVGATAVALFGASWLVYRARGVPLFEGRGGKREREGMFPGVTAVEWCGLIVAVLLFSPQTMIRHTYLLLFLHQVAAYLALVKRPGVARLPLIVGLVAFQCGSRLPPGNAGMDELVDAWRSIGGSSWCMMVMFLGFLWTALGFVKAGRVAETDRS